MSTDDSVPSVEETGAYRLFNGTSIFIAAFLGSVLAGAVLIAINYRRLGQARKAIATVVIGIAVLALAITVATLIPTAASTAVALGLAFATKGVAQLLQGEEIEQHVRQGGMLSSKWAAAGVGLGFVAVIFGGVLLFEFALEQNSRVVIGSKDEVYYSGSATKQQARSVGEALKSAGYFRDRGVTVLLSRSDQGAVISFVVKDGAWDRPDMVAAFEEIGREIAPAAGGFPIKVRLVNLQREPEKEATVGKVIVGRKDELYYFGSATEADAKALGESLKSAAFFQDRGVTVLLAKDDNGSTVSFVVSEGTWDNSDQVSGFERLVRQSAGSIGGLPIHVHLVNSRLEIKKAITVS